MSCVISWGAAPHTDHLDDWWHPRLGNERIATMIIYLSAVLEGGETVFPNSTGPLVYCLPSKVCANTQASSETLPEWNMGYQQNYLPGLQHHIVTEASALTRFSQLASKPSDLGLCDAACGRSSLQQVRAAGSRSEAGEGGCAPAVQPDGKWPQ